MPGAGIQNNINFSQGNKLFPSQSTDISNMQEGADSVSSVNFTGDPNGNVSANPSSLCHDPVSGDVYIKESGTGDTGWVLIGASGQDLHISKFIVGDITNGANYATIADVLADVSSGDTIVLQQGTYTEDFTITTSRLTFCAMTADGLNYDGGGTSVSIVGKITFDTPGGEITRFSGISFIANGDFVFTNTGSNTIGTYCRNCYFYSTTDFIINDTGSNGARFYFYNCNFDLNGSGVGFCNCADAFSTISLYECHVIDTAGSTTPSTITTTGSQLLITGGQFGNMISMSGESSLGIFNCQVVTSGANSNAITLAGTAGCTLSESSFFSGSNAVISAGSGTTATISNCSINSSAANAFTGAGTVKYGGCTFTGTSVTTNATTENYFPLSRKQGGTGISVAGTSGNVLTSDGTDWTSAAPAAAFLNYTNVAFADSPYTVLPADQYISVDSSGGSVILLFPNAPTAERQWIVKDRTGDAASNNIIITTVGGAVTFDGSPTLTIDAGYRAVSLLANATPTYEIYTGAV